jgi:hypothetical protein
VETRRRRIRVRQDDTVVVKDIVTCALGCCGLVDCTKWCFGICWCLCYHTADAFLIFICMRNKHEKHVSDSLRDVPGYRVMQIRLQWMLRPLGSAYWEISDIFLPGTIEWYNWCVPELYIGVTTISWRCNSTVLDSCASCPIITHCSSRYRIPG